MLVLLQSTTPPPGATSEPKAGSGTHTAPSKQAGKQAGKRHHYSRHCALSDHTWFLCRVPSSSSEELFMVPHRSFTILRRMCTFDPPVRSRRQRIETLEGVSGSDFLPTPPPPPPPRTHTKIRYLNANKKGGNNYFCGSANRTRRNQKNYAPNSLRVVRLFARYSHKTMMK